MSLGEFALIDRFFSRPLLTRDDVLVGIGDDGAVLRLGADQRLVTSVAVSGTAAQRAQADDPARLGNDLMAAALNRLAAAGAQPAWATLALTLPQADEDWLAAFSDALFAIAGRCSVALVGGDTTRGPFAATVVGHGLLDNATAAIEPRIGVGDGVYVSGSLHAGTLSARPMPSTIRVALGRRVRTWAGVAADLSEGLGAALAALLGSVTLGARIDLATLPLAAAAHRHLDTRGGWSRLPSARGDMELCFSVPATAHADLIAWASASRTPVTRVASVDTSAALTLIDGAGRPLPDWNAVPVGTRP
jgi:thiamine-monophosphate kinase